MNKVSIPISGCTAVASAGGKVLDHGEGIVVGGWTFQIAKGPIAPDQQCECLKNEIGTLAIPEQWFYKNRLEISHPADQTHRVVVLRFCAADAIRLWAKDQPPPIQVPASQVWKEHRTLEMDAHGAKQLTYDWTFTSSKYLGNLLTVGNESLPQWKPTSKQFDRKALTARDPILMYAELPLYESELEDNGISQLSVKIRVMPTCWFVLLRFFLRVDGILVRLMEVRYFSKLSSGPVPNGEILREVKYVEGTFAELRAGGAPPDGPAYIDGDGASMALQAVAPVGVKNYRMEALDL
jgi:type 2A phosphatase activator TIP41